MSGRLEFGAMIPLLGQPGVTDPESHRRLAVGLEEEGYDIAVVPDHIVLPESVVDAEYPYSDDGTPPFDLTDAIFEPLTVLARLSELTDTIHLGTNILVVPYRHPLLLTRQLTNIAAISDGRLEVGAGVGWARGEFDALDVPFDERGGRADEFFRIFDRACTETEFAYDGEYFSFDRLSFYPTPPNGRPPVWIGGHSGAAFRRVAEFGDGWAAAYMDPETVAAARGRIRRAWDDFDREGEPEIAITNPVYVGSDRSSGRPMTGSPDSIVDDIHEYVDAGVTRVIMDFYTDDTTEQLAQARRFADEVLPEFA